MVKLKTVLLFLVFIEVVVDSIVEIAAYSTPNHFFSIERCGTWRVPVSLIINFILHITYIKYFFACLMKHKRTEAILYYRLKN